MKLALAEDHADLLFDLLFPFPDIHSQNLHVACVTLNNIQHGLNRRRFSGSVLPDQSHDASHGNIQADVI